MHQADAPFPLKTREGRRAHRIPAQLQEPYTEAQSGAARHLRDEIAILDARISQLTRRVSRGDPSRWKQLAALLKQIDADTADGNPPDGADIATNLRRILAAQRDYDSAWQQIQSVALAKARLVDTQTRLRSAEAARVTRADLDQLVATVRATLEHICTREQLAQFHERVMTLEILRKSE